MGIMYKLMKHRNLTMDLNNSPHHHNISNTKTERNRLLTIDGNIIENPDSLNEDLNQKNMDSNLDKRFTAEHIIQLCKFLAEKSKRNKNLYKQQQSPKKLIKSKQTQFQFHQMDYEDNEDESDLYQNEALPLLSQQRLQEQQRRNHHKIDNVDDDVNDDNVDDDNEGNSDEDNEFEKQKHSAVLSTRLSPDINSLNISSNTSNTCTLQQQQQQHQMQQQQYIQRQQQQQQIFNQQQSLPQNQGKRDILLKIRRQIFERKRLREENVAFEPQAFNNSQVWRPW